MALTGDALLFPKLVSTVEEHVGVMTRRVIESVFKHLEASFSKPERGIWNLQKLKLNHYQLFCFMDFQVMTYSKRPNTFTISSERRPTGRLYNDGPNIRLEVLSVSDLIKYLLREVDISRFVLCLGVQISVHLRFR
jgi:hypothetical protein